MKFRKGQSGNPGGRPKALGEVQELARQYAPKAIVELARLALKAKNETVRIAAMADETCNCGLNRRVRGTLLV